MTTISCGQVFMLVSRKNVSRRIKEHFDDEAMDWWTKAAAFTTKDNAFNQAHARYLEWARVHLAT